MKNNNLWNFLIAFLILTIVALTFFYIMSLKNNKTLYVSNLIYDELDEDKGQIKSIFENTKDMEINAWYKLNNIKVLDQYTLNKTNEVINRFKLEINNKLNNKVSNQKYYLRITFDEYSSKKYISYKINATSFTGELNSSNKIHTVNYDKSEKKIVFLKDIIKEYGGQTSFLTLMSEYIMKEIKKDDKVKDFTFDMLELTDSYIKPVIDNYEDFVIEDDYLTVFFEEGTIMPKVFGEFYVAIPLNIFFKR